MEFSLTKVVALQEAKIYTSLKRCWKQTEIRKEYQGLFSITIWTSLIEIKIMQSKKYFSIMNYIKDW